MRDSRFVVGGVGLLDLARMLAVAAAYFLAAKFGLSLAFATKQVTAVWPPTGVSFVALLLLGYRAWPGVFLGAFLANLTASEGALTAAGIAVGNTLTGVLGVWLARRVGRLDARLEHLKDVVALVIGGGALACLLSASAGVANLVWAGIVPPSGYGSVWWVWWLGDTMGVLLFAPFLLAWLQPPARPSRHEERAELALLLLLLVGVCQLGFLGPAQNNPFSRAYTVVISSLINMQIRKLEAGENRDALEECRTRVQAIALIHEKLYQSRDYAEIPFSEYAKSLAISVFDTANVSRSQVELELGMEDVALGVDQAIPCGLVMNELITNALKHGFAGGRRGKIRIELSQLPGAQVRLAVHNDGVGLPEGFESVSSRSLGLQLVNTLAAQLKGQLEIERSAGTTFLLTFPLPH